MLLHSYFLLTYVVFYGHIGYADYKNKLFSMLFFLRKMYTNVTFNPGLACSCTTNITMH